MVPVFKSHYSIGRSILTLKPDSSEGGPSSIFEIAQEYELPSITLVEDTLTGFLEAYKVSRSLGIDLFFGLRITVCEDSSKEVEKGGDLSAHKIIIFAQDSNGCRKLNEIYSHAFTKGSGRIDFSYLEENWEEESLKLAIPFYDSFIFNNLMSFSTCLLDCNFTSPTLFIEENELPFDSMLKLHCEQYSTKHSLNTELVKSIYYKSREDFSAYQTYKCICSRSSFGRGSSLDKPNLDHCSSKEFCIESWADTKKPATSAGFNVKE